MKDIICIVCPNSCHLQVDEVTLKVIGQQCKRGETYGKHELHNPTRSLTTSVRTKFKHQPSVSVRTRGEVPKIKIAEIMRQLQPIIIDKPLPRGSVIIENVSDTGIDIITTTDLTQGADYD